MKRILHIANTDKAIHDFRFELLLALQAMGHEIHICARSIDVRFPEIFKKEGFIFHNAPIERGLHPINALRSSWFVKKIIEKYDFELIHTHTPTGGMIGRLAARLAGHKKVFHTTAGLYFHENMSKMKYNFFAGIERWLTSKTEVLFSPNYDDIETCKELNIKPITELAYCGPAGVAIEQFPIVDKSKIQEALKTELNIPQDHQLIGLVARVEFEKGYREFVTIVDRLHREGTKVTGICVGTGRDIEKLQEFIKERDLKNSLFLGYRTDIPKIIACFDILLFPSYREGLPIVTLEAMAARTPIVAYNIRGCRESIVDGKTGVLVPFKDEEQLFLETKKLLKQPEVRKKMGEQGRARVIANYTKQLHVDRQMPFYKQFIN